MTPEGIKSQLCATFCDGFHVAEVPDGLLVETPFAMADGDHLDFLIREMGDNLRLEDDGMLVAEAAAAGIDIVRGTRRQIMEDLLGECGTRFDEDEGIFFTELPSRGSVGSAVVRFVEALLRARDVAMLTRERVASSFADDLEEALAKNVPGGLRLSRSDMLQPENPADIIVLRDDDPVAAIYAVTNTEKLLAALVRHLEVGMNGPEQTGAPLVFAALEELDKVSQKRFAHAQNRGLAMPIADGNMDDAVRYITERLPEAA